MKIIEQEIEQELDNRVLETLKMDPTSSRILLQLSLGVWLSLLGNSRLLDEVRKSDLRFVYQYGCLSLARTVNSSESFNLYQALLRFSPTRLERTIERVYTSDSEF